VGGPAVALAGLPCRGACITRTDARLKRWKYAVLAVLILAPLVSAPWTDRLVEVEPFKTSITLNFVRSWPYVAWAAGLVVLGALVYKAYCRYLCPLGAGLAVLGHLRQLGLAAAPCRMRPALPDLPPPLRIPGHHRPVRSTTPSASNAWTAWPSTTAMPCARRASWPRARAAPSRSIPCR
jgi:hypothetical protein